MQLYVRRCTPAVIVCLLVVFLAFSGIVAPWGAGPTVSKFGLQPSAADHIFARGLTVLGLGRVDSITASDHFPVWVELAPSG